MAIRVGHTAIEVVVRRPSSQSQTKVGWLAVQAITQEKPAAKANFAAVQVIVRPKPVPSPAVNNIKTEVMIRPAFGPTAINNIKTEVMATPGRPLARVYNLNLEVATQGLAESQFTWMGLQALHSAEPAIQANMTWMGLSFLVPAKPNISLSWMSVQALVDINSVDDIPDYLNYGSLFDVYPGAVEDSVPLEITGMTPNYPIEIYSDSDILFSTNGIDFSPTIMIQLGDELILRKVVTALYNQTFRLFVVSGIGGETEIGMWQLPGPSGTLKYDDWIDRGIDSGPWIEIKDQENQHVSSPESKIAEFQLMESIAPDGLFSDNNESLYPMAPDGESINDNENPIAMAPTGTVEGPLSFLSIKDARIFVLYKNYIHYVKEAITDNFKISSDNYFNTLANSFELNSNYFHTMSSPDQFSARYEQFILSKNVSKFYTIYQETGNTEFQSYTEYWKNWESYKANIGWMYESYNDHLGPDRLWENYKLEDNILVNPLWAYESFGDGHEIDINFIYGEILNVARNILVNFEPMFESTRTPYWKELLSKFEPMANPILPTRELYYTYEYALKNISVDLYGNLDKEVIFQSTNYVRQGGFMTPTLAENAAEQYPDNLTVIYQQPEGTYSFDVIYDNELWCGEAPVNPVLKAVAWYLGGG